MFEEEGTIRKMSRAVATFQTLRAYGGYYWRVRQHLATSKQMADNDSSLGKRLPKKTLVLNPNGKPDDEYWMCVHDTCLKFINATPIDKKYDINATNIADLNDSEAIEKLENKMLVLETEKNECSKKEQDAELEKAQLARKVTSLENQLRFQTNLNDDTKKEIEKLDSEISQVATSCGQRE